MRALHQLWLGSVLSLAVFAQQATEFELPRPVWGIENGDIGPAGIPVRASAAFTSNGKDIVFGATEIGAGNTAIYASERLVLRSGVPFPGVPNLTITSFLSICPTESLVPWIEVLVSDQTGFPGQALMQGGRVLFYPGQDPSVAGLPSIGVIDRAGIVRGATDTVGFCAISVLRPDFSRGISIHRVTTDGLGRIQSMQLAYRTRGSHPAFPTPITSFAGSAMSPSGRLIIGVAANDSSTGTLHGSILLDDIPVLSRGEVVPGTSLPVGGFRSLGVNDRGDWAAAVVLGPAGVEDVLVKNGELLYSESVGTPLFGTPLVDEIRIIRMTDDGRLFWLLSAIGFSVPGVPPGESFRAIFCDDELVATNAGSYLEGEPLNRLTYAQCAMDSAGHFLSMTTNVRTAAGALRERVFIVPMDASTTYCDNGATSAGLTPQLGIYGSSELEHETGYQAIGRFLPPGQVALMLASPDATSGAVLGASQGELCLGGSIVRSQLLVASRLGDVSVDLEGFMPQPGNAPLMPGDRLNFQAWYRDQDASGASVTRLTEAVGVQFD